MPPEQIQGKEADARSDVYAIGAVLYEMLTGHILFERDTEFELLNSQISEKPKPLREFNHEVSPELEKIILRALEKEPGKRYASAREFSEVIRRLLLAEPSASLTHQNSLIAFCKDYPAVAIAASLLLPVGSYIAWQLNFADPSQVSQSVVFPVEKLVVEPTQRAIVENQSIEAERITAITSEKIPEMRNSLQSFPPNLPSSGNVDIGDSTVEDTFDIESELMHVLPMPERKPEVPEYFVQTNKQSAKQISTSAQQNIVTKTKPSSSASDKPVDDPRIDEWAKDFFEN
ncbi:MAG TPA: protein kinase, partial [Chitinophagales bacterium]|nr:protein kinase [Chitinophagales bacterium]